MVCKNYKSLNFPFLDIFNEMESTNYYSNFTNNPWAREHQKQAALAKSPINVNNYM